ncbi:MAG: 1-deoxy-D-xylulose-5-phosphate synthase N-terminal domain-containing protein, partial [Steroidobacteraceae bacterium]
MTTVSPLSLLAQVNDPVQLRALPDTALPKLADELRAFMLTQVAATGGHLASGLGTVELAIALHHSFDTPRDPLIWDVGHQAYPHKILTGRRDELHGIRKRPGISGFLRRDESPYDAFGAGHSSTSISAALGMAVAARTLGQPVQAVAVIGDGALTAGLAFEALDHAGGMGEDLLVILNDNGMSISENVGALSQRLTTQGRTGADDAASFFRALGFEYSGPIDGHDLTALLPAIRAIKEKRGPRLLHVVTCKGKGYDLAEAEPIKYHGVTPFDPVQGLGGGG